MHVLRLPSSFTRIVSGSAETLRPWGLRFPDFVAPVTQPPPAAPARASEKRLTYASLNSRKIFDYLHDAQFVQAFDQTKIHATSPGWEAHLARDIFGQAQLYHQLVNDDDSGSVEEWYLECDTEFRAECQLPSEVPFSFVAAVVVAADMTTPAAISELKKAKLPDGRPMTDVLVVCETAEQSVQWQQAFVLNTFENIHQKASPSLLLPRVGQKKTVFQELEDRIAVRCFGRKKAKKRAQQLAEQASNQIKLLKEEEGEQVAALTSLRSSVHRKLLNELLCLLGG